MIKIGILTPCRLQEPHAALGDGLVCHFSRSQKPLEERWGPAQQFSQVWINVIGAIALAHMKAEVANTLALRHVDKKRVDALRGNVVVHILQRPIR